MLKFLKWVKTGFWALLATLTLSSLIVIGVFQQRQTVQWEDITSSNNISRDYAGEYRSAVEKSRLSAVRVHSSALTFWGGTSTMTGTYFVASGKPYVITVHHGIQGPCWLVTIDHESTQVNCKEYILKDELRDYVIMELEKPISTRTPIRIPQDLPAGSLGWKDSYSLLTNIIYTGYPNTIGPLTLRGDVVGYAAEEYFYVFSHAYGGASGSGVFTREGRYIGYILAIDVGSTDLGIDILENIVIVAPSFNVDWSVVTD